MCQEEFQLVKWERVGRQNWVPKYYGYTVGGQCSEVMLVIIIRKSWCDKLLNHHQYQQSSSRCWCDSVCACQAVINRYWIIILTPPHCAIKYTWSPLQSTEHHCTVIRLNIAQRFKCNSLHCIIFHIENKNVANLYCLSMKIVIKWDNHSVAGSHESRKYRKNSIFLFDDMQFNLYGFELKLGFCAAVWVWSCVGPIMRLGY